MTDCWHLAALSGIMQSEIKEKITYFLEHVIKQCKRIEFSKCADKNFILLLLVLLLLLLLLLLIRLGKASHLLFRVIFN